MGPNAVWEQLFGWAVIICLMLLYGMWCLIKPFVLKHLACLIATGLVLLAFGTIHPSFPLGKTAQSIILILCLLVASLIAIVTYTLDLVKQVGKDREKGASGD